MKRGTASRGLVVLGEDADGRHLHEDVIVVEHPHDVGDGPRITGVAEGVERLEPDARTLVLQVREQALPARCSSRGSRGSGRSTDRGGRADLPPRRGGPHRDQALGLLDDDGALLEITYQKSTS